MSLLDAAKRLLEVLDRDHSLGEKHEALGALAVAAGVAPVPEPVAAEVVAEPAPAEPVAETEPPAAEPEVAA